jgi:hypothetical protein
MPLASATVPASGSTSRVLCVTGAEPDTSTRETGTVQE